ncbi:uncharacterized protein SPPG_00069 [Spizellomyces punctatus DAOM BR117]|uniref:MABP1/WDR62 second WD40 domain-containing protein n=1 Tax=Spizellomyces punctatus (strain DAOM BR117) TaxID=645134 RepID=A0A0L0HT87_SPIPD|nr:uncharacterized protein SPPG_00069 [Spizellomyces punctatus DAOM BR117]KND04338.1 hypothetical protein SPPG_00069 [Spizellomyces punctatus DAOM BR117]|eukprot:XP_016612377.1 hypothetical protein SPPG_00069 [Spizellomyces punctatus DAOM BR117]
MFAKRANSSQGAWPKPGRKRGRQKDAEGQSLQLERVLGLSVTRPSALTLNQNLDTPVLAYPAGGIVVLYNYKRNRQVGFLTPNATFDAERGAGSTGGRRASLAAGGKAVSCVAYSQDGEYLAVGEAGHQPKVLIWKGSTLVSELVGHLYGVLAVAFCPDCKYLVSVGYQHDGLLYVWNWRTGQRLAYAKLDAKIHSLAFSPKGDFFVTVGVQHVTFWPMDADKLVQNAKAAKPVNIVLEGTSGQFTSHKNCVFMDVACSTASDGKTTTYSITDDGTLVCFSHDRELVKWVELKVPGRSVNVSAKYIACGCADGVIRLFETFTMQYIVTLPKTHPIDVHPHTRGSPTSSSLYPDVEAIAIDAHSEKLACIFNDHSLLIWNIKDPKHPKTYRSFLWHSDAIWGVEMVPTIADDYPSVDSESPPSGLPPNTFVTYSSDGTVRFWNLDGTSSAHSVSPTGSETSNGLTVSDYFRQNDYSRELLRILYVDRAGILKLKTHTDGEPSAAEKTGVRALRVTPDGQFLASGDRLGNVRVHELVTFQQLKFLEAHEAEVLSIDFSDDPHADSFLMATASRDRLIHVFDGARDFELVQTLDDHTSSITSVRFCDNGRRLMSCGADRSLIFRVTDTGNGFQSYHKALSRSTIYDLDIDATSKYLATVSQDRRINVYSVNTGKSVRSYRPEFDDTSADSGFTKLSLDQSGAYAATSASDKTIRIFDFYSGDCLGRVASGHSELVTGVKFTLDCKHLISTGADGCIFVWKLSKRITQQMQKRLGKKFGSGNGATRSNSFTQSQVSAPETDQPSFQSGELGDTSSIRSSGDALPSNEPASLPFLFSELGLPAWARTTRNRELEADQGRFVAPKGRWAQRVGQEGVMLFSELSESAPPVARMDDVFDRRYTFEQDRIPNTPRREEGASVTKITDGLAGPSDQIIRHGVTTNDMVVQDLDSMALTSSHISDDDVDEPTEMDIEDDEEFDEDHIVFLPSEDKEDTLYIVMAQDAKEQSHDASETAPVDESRKSQTPEQSPDLSNTLVEPDKISRTPKTGKEEEDDEGEGGSGSKEFGDMTFEEYIGQSVALSAGLDIRQSLSAKHLALRNHETTSHAENQSLKAQPSAEEEKGPMPISTVSETRTSSGDEGTEAASTTSLRQRKEATAQEVAKVRQKLAAMGIIWRSAENLALTELPSESAAETPAVQNAIENPELVHAISHDAERADDQQNPAQMEERPYTPHETAPELVRSPYRSRSMSPIRSAVNRDVIVNAIAHPVPAPHDEARTPAGSQEGANQTMEEQEDEEEKEEDELDGGAAVPDNVVEMTDPATDAMDQIPKAEGADLESISVDELKLFRSLADRSAQALVKLATRKPSSDEERIANEIRSSLNYVYEATATALEKSDPPPEALFKDGKMIHLLEKYSEILVDMVQKKLQDGQS